MVYQKHKDNFGWTIDSWKVKNNRQNFYYHDSDRCLLEKILTQLKQGRGLLPFHEVEMLRKELEQTSEKKSFIIQAGDCAETIKNTEKTEFYASSMNFLLQMLAQKFSAMTDKNTILFGRLAGQMAKPRSEINFKSNIYRGDLVNSFYNNTDERIPNPQRIMDGYIYIKKLIESIKNINSKLYFCHEALLLPYEQSLVRFDNGKYFASSAHLLWVGNRTRHLDSAQIEFCRGLYNPIGVKLSSEISPQELLQLCDILNPANEIGKLLFITRMGAEKINSKFPLLLEATIRAGKNLIWLCDPMHGNTKLYQGYKTRYIDAIKSEAKSFFAIHKELGGYATGIHLELTFERVTECIDFSSVKPDNLKQNYTSFCDPRLNYDQAVDFFNYLVTII